MNQLPIQPVTPEQQQAVMAQMYRLCAKQVQSYQQHRHMGFCFFQLPGKDLLAQPKRFLHI